MTQLPGIAGDIEQLIGLDLTVQLLKARGGTEITIPRRAAGTDLAGLIGEDAAQKLSDEMLPGRLRLPCGQMRGRDAERNDKKAKAIDLLKAGNSNRNVALACDLHMRTVERYRAEIDGPDDQPQLPL